ncbi:MAG: DNA polymerase I [Bacteroidetes bacterium]|nr:MAG: DNA polymerase I [Bacteroidota bacterium]
MAKQKKLFLLDAMALIYRAYFALNKNPRINSRGLNTSAILGFANTLLEVLRNEQPTHIGVAFDTKAPTIREESYAEYKANRERMPEDISLSIPYIVKLIEAFNIPVLKADGYEADDVIGTLAKRAEQEDFEVFMMTPDKDFGQLVSDNIYMYKPARMGKKAEVLGPDEICEKYKIREPEQFIDILGLWGDASDNIPGVPGVGEKTASKLIGEFGSIENLLLNTDKLKGKLKENVENFSDQAIMSKQLATIILDVPVAFNEDELKHSEPNREALTELFEELEFRTFAQRIFKATEEKKSDELTEDKEDKGDLFSSAGVEVPLKNLQDVNSVSHDYALAENSKERAKLIRKLKEADSFCFDTETTGLNANDTELVAMSFAVKKGEAWLVPVPENYQEALELVSEFKELFEDDQIGKIGQNLKFDMSVLRWYDVEVKGKLFDTMIAHYLIEPDMRHNMDLLAETYLDYRTIPIQNLIGKKGKNQLSMRTVSPAMMKDYACEDADITLQLKEIFDPLLNDAGTIKLFNGIEMPLVPVLASMEAEGVKLETATLADFSSELEQGITRLEKEIKELAGADFNIASPKQLGEILFEKLKVTDKPRLTKTKQYSTGEDVLLKLADRHPIIDKILDFRSLAKLKSTYVDALPRLINPRDNRIHTSYNQAVAATGRLSSNNPNLQNIPIRTEMGREIRKAFVPRSKEYTLLAADYSQIELRIIAELSKDQGLIDTFVNGLDVHTATAARIFSVDLEDVTTDMRRSAKTVNFGIVYGISAFGLSERLNIPRKEAADIIAQYFAKYPGVKSYMEQTIDFARKNGYVETMMGRRRYLRDINSSNATVRGYAERNAINAPVQGSSADMIKIAMISIHEVMQKEKMKSKMILQVHDELVFDAYEKELDMLRELVGDKMRSAIPMTVPVVVDMNTGNNWLQAH